MRLDIAFEANQRPEAQHQLRQIPSAEQVDHPELRTALERFEEARTAELEARQTHVQLEQELPAAEYQDELALADAREKHKPDPGPKNAERHQRAIAEAKRDWGARRIALQRAVEGVVAAFEKFGDEWEAALIVDRDRLRGSMGEKLAGWEELWRDLQRNSANRAIARGSGTQSPTVFADSFRVPLIRDGSLIQVTDVLEGLRGLAAPQQPAKGAVENLEVGAEPTRHTPPSKQPFAGMGSQAMALGASRDPEKVREWVEQDEREARARGAALSEERRQERMGRADQRHAERDAQRDALAGV